MNNKTDERVVSLKFDNSGFAKKVSETRDQLKKLDSDLALNNTEKASSKIEAFFKKINTEIKSVSFDPLKTGANTVALEFSKMQVAIAGILLNITKDVYDASKKMIKSLSVDNIMQGYEEYELKMESIRTMMASDTTHTLEQINEYLDELNEYADKTIYKFSDMTTAIGRFVSMGVDVETATKAIQGASSMVALTGGGNAENQRVMYNTAQALATGYMTLLDWRSMENARVSNQWYKQIIEVMKELDAAGKLSEDAAAFYKESAKNYGYFRENLKEGYVTQDIIIKSLMKFSDETTELGKRAITAATEVTTFSKLMDTLKEAVGSSWARTFELLLGDYDEAKTLWTYLNKEIGSMIENIGKFRNKILEEWADNGGYKQLIDSIQNVVKAFKSVIEPIKEAWNIIFPETKPEKLVDLLFKVSSKLKEITKKLILNKTQIERVKKAFIKIFNVLKAVKNIILVIVNVIRKIVWPVVKVIGSFILSLIDGILSLFSGVATAINSFTGGLLGSSKKAQKVNDTAKNIKKTIDDVTKSVDNSTSSLKDIDKALSDIGSTLSDTTDTAKKENKELSKTESETAKIQENIKKAVEAGKTLTDENYIYTKNGLAIPKKVDIKEDSILGGIKKIIDALRGIWTGSSDIEDKVQDTFKKVGTGVEKAITKVSGAAKNISKNSLLYKSSSAIRGIVDKTFSALDGSFKRTKTNIINTSGVLKKLTGGFGNLFNVNKNKKKNTTVKDVEKTATTIATANKNSTKMLDNVKKNTDALTDAFDKAAETPDKMETIGEKAAKKVEETIGNAIETVFNKTLKWFGEEAKDMDWSKMTNDQKLQTLFSTLGSLIKEHVGEDTLDEIKESFKDIGKIIKNIIRIASEVFRIFGRSIKEVFFGIDDSENKATDFFETFKMVVSKVHEFLDALVEVLSNITLIDKKTKKLTPTGEKVKKVIDVIVKVLKVVITIALGIIKIILGIIGLIYKISSGEAGKALSDAFNDIVDSISGAFDTLKKNLENAKTGVLGTISSLFTDITSLLSGQKDSKILDNMLTNMGLGPYKTLYDDIQDMFLGEEIHVDITKLLDDVDAIVQGSEKASNDISNVSKDVKKASEDAQDSVDEAEKASMSFTDKLAHNFWMLYGKLIYWMDDLYDRALKYLNETTGKEFWDKVMNTKVFQFSTALAKFVLAVMSAAVEIAFDSLFKKFIHFMDMDYIFDTSSIEDMTFWDKLKYMFSGIFSGAFSEAVKNTGAYDFITWFVGSLFEAIFNKLNEVKTKILSLFGISSNKESDMFGVMSSSSSTEGIEQISKSLASLNSDTDESVNWNKYLAPAMLLAIVYEIVHTLYLLTDSIKAANLGTGLSDFISKITKAFTAFTAVATVATVIEFTMVIYILAKALQFLGTIDTNTIAKNTDQLLRIIRKVADIIIEMFVLQALLAGLNVGLGALSKKKGITSVGKSKNYFYSITGLILGMATSVYLLVSAMKKLAEVPDIEKLNGIIDKVMDIFETIASYILIIVAIAGILGIASEKASNKTETKISDTINQGFNIKIGTNTNNFAANPLTAIGPILEQIAKILLIIIGGFVAITAVSYFLNKMEGGPEAIKQAEHIMVGMLIACLAFMAVMFIGTQKVIKAVPNNQDVAPILKQLGLVIAAIGYAFSSIFFAISLLAFAVSREGATAGKLGVAAGIIAIVFGGIIALMYILLHSVDKFLKMSMNNENGKVYLEAMNQMINSLAKFMSAIVKPLRWVFAGIALMIRMSAKVDPGKMGIVAGMIGEVFIGLGILMGVALYGVYMILNRILKSATSDSEVETIAKAASSLMDAISDFMFGIAMAMAIMITALAGLMLAIDMVKDPNSMWKAIGIAGALLLIIFGILALVLWAVDSYNKKGIQVDTFAKFLNAMSILMGVVAGMMLIMVGSLLAITFAINSLKDPSAFDTAVLAMEKIFLGIVILLSFFVAITLIFDKFNVSGTEMLEIAGAFVLFASSFIVIALAMSMLNDALSAIPEENWDKMILIFVAFVGIVTLLGVLAGINPAIAEGFMAIGAAFLFFGLSLLSVAAAVYIVVKAMDLLIEVIERFSGEKEKIREGIEAMIELLPRIQVLISGIISSIIGGLIQGVVDSSYKIGEALANAFVSALEWLANNLDRIFTALDKIWETIKSHILTKMFGGMEGESGGELIGEFFDGLRVHLFEKLREWQSTGNKVEKAVAKLLCGIFQVESPSKLTSYIGKMLVAGLDKGIENKQEQNGLLGSITSLKDKISGAIGDGNSLGSLLSTDGLSDKINELIGDELNLEQVLNITPEMDMSTITGQMGDLNSMLGSTDVGLTTDSFNSMTNTKAMQDMMNQNGTGDVYNVTTMEQNNYSPKSLDAATQYRQTNNLVDNSLRQTGTTAGGHAMYGHRESRRVQVGTNALGRPIYKYQK